MYGTVEQVGQKLTCPDCGTASVVPPPRAVAKATAAPAAVDVYPLASEAGPTAGAPRASEQSYVAVICHRCGTRLLATLDQVGDTLLCPDCGMANIVPPPPEKKQKAKKEAVASYRMAKGSEEESPVAVEEPEVMRKSRLKPHSERPGFASLAFHYRHVHLSVLFPVRWREWGEQRSGRCWPRAWWRRASGLARWRVRSRGLLAPSWDRWLLS